MDFSNKVVVVTGGGQGIGACIAHHYAKQKATVVIAEIDEEAGRPFFSIKHPNNTEPDHTLIDE